MPRAFSNRKPTKAVKKGAVEVLNGEGRKSQITTTASPKLNNRGGGDADEANSAGKLTAKSPIKSRGGGGGRGKKFAEEISEQPAVISASVEVIGKGRKRKADTAVENGSTAKDLEESADINEKMSKSRGGRKKVGVENKSETKSKASPDKSPKSKTVRGRGKAQIEVQNENVEAEINEIKKGSPKANPGGGRRKKKDPPTSLDLNDSNVKDIPTIDENEKAVPPKKRSYSKKSKVEAAQDVEEPAEEEIIESSSPKRSRIDKTPKKPRQARVTKPGGKKVTEAKKNVANKVASPRGGGRGGNRRNVKGADLDEKTDVLSGNKAQEESKADGRKISGKEKKTVTKTAKSTVKRGVKKTNELMEQNEPMQEQAEKTSTRSRKRSAVAEPDQIDGGKGSKNKKAGTLESSATVPLNNIETVYKKSDFDLATAGDNEYNLKISSWNVAGLRSWLKKGGLSFLDYEQPDIFCLQETKCTTDQLPEQAERIPGYHPYWLCQPGGYAGVAIYSKIMPINVEYGIGNDEFDKTGRLITAEYEKFFLVCTYTPNSGRKLVNLELRMRWEKLFQAYVQQLDNRKPVIICGDMNVSHQEIDLANPKTNMRNAGFTKEEREKMTELLSLGFIDTFRQLYPEVTGAYTFWTYIGGARGRNVGWRLDYFLVSQRFIKRVVDSCIRSQVKGSDHCPITLFLKL